MPSFYPNVYPRRLPLSPAEYGTAYALGRGGDMSALTHMSFAAPQHALARHEKDAHEYLDPYGPASAFAAPGPLPPPYGHPSMVTTTTGYDPYHAPAPAPAARAPSAYGAAAPTAMPPVPFPDRAPSDDPGSQRHAAAEESRAKPQESPATQKPLGGVAAYLDYEMEQMSDFVSEMAQGIVQSGSPVSPAFRKFVSQILASTRLPSSTILLALYYLATRMTLLSSRGQRQTVRGQVYRMLTTALLLGSKFLDDNTFQNRSWSEVSGLTIPELNRLETEWLVAIDWNLHIDPIRHQGFQAVADRWHAWTHKAAARAAAPVRLAPIDTSVPRRYSRPQDISPPLPYASQYAKSVAANAHAEGHPSHYGPPSRFDKSGWAFARGAVEYSPPSAPETGPTTPDYGRYGSSWHFNNPPPPPYAMRHPTHALGPLPPYHHAPSYAPCFAPSIWSSHTTGCNCAYCARAHEPYFMAPAYGLQPVAG